MTKAVKTGRPAGEPTTIIRVPVDKISTVERLLGRRGIADGQTPNVNVRVPTAKVKTIRAAIKKG